MAAMTQRKRRIETGILVLLCSGFAALAQETVRLDGQRIDEALNRMVSDGRAAGVSVLVWKDGKEAHFGAAGFADREAQRPMARDTIAQIYSMTKPITGVALMQLWEQGKFGLDDPLSRYLPEFESMQVYAGRDAAGRADLSSAGAADYYSRHYAAHGGFCVWAGQYAGA